MRFSKPVISVRTESCSCANRRQAQMIVYPGGITPGCVKFMLHRNSPGFIGCGFIKRVTTFETKCKIES